MSDKLIDLLLNERRDFGDVWIADAEAKAIVAALRAGQAMRDVMDQAGHDACVAWDAACKE